MRIYHWSLALALLLCMLGHAPAQTSSPMTNSDVVQMTKAGISANTVVHAIQTSTTAFDTSASALVDLKKQGVPDVVLDAMLASQKNAGHLPVQNNHCDGTAIG